MLIVVLAPLGAPKTIDAVCQPTVRATPKLNQPPEPV